MSTTESTTPALLCDADGCLFPSEDPAYDASAVVTAGFLTEMGIDERLTAEQLRLEFTGLNFRATAQELCRRHGVQVGPDTLEHWVGVERDVVTRHLGQVLRPDASVEEPLRSLGESVQLAVVSSSALPRLDVCLAATGLSRLFWTSHRYSAESLRPPRSKPAPDVYVAALRGLRIHPSKALAVEDSAVGVRAAVAAGIPVVGLVQFVAEAEERRRELLAAGALDVLGSWHEVVELAGSHLLSSGLPSSGATSRRIESDGGSPSSAASRRR